MRVSAPPQLKDAAGDKIKVSAPDAKRLFKAADTSRDGYVNFNECVIAPHISRVRFDDLH